MKLPFTYQPQMITSVVGPTATGKTEYAFDLAHLLLNEYDLPVVALISADSRQVYSGLEIVSGADIPAEFKRVSYQNEVEPSSYFTQQIDDKSIELHGVSCLHPDAEWSLAHFQRFAHQVIAKTWEKGGAVIIVGGTGLYHARLFSTELQTKKGPDPELRKQLQTTSLVALQNIVKKQSSAFFEQMTLSDQHNPRRLVRAIEQLQDDETSPEQKTAEVSLVVPSTHHIIGLTDSIENIEERIKQRVLRRLEQGAIQEVEHLVVTYPQQPKLLIFSATGVKEILAYLQQKITFDQLKEVWFRRERQYAKRQLTWWKKNSECVWLQATTLQLSSAG